jgi:tetratricopeptide (TPR) repeat protein
MIVGVTGYPHTYASRGVMSIPPHLPALFNNIGVLHLSSGALHDSICILEESIEFQKVNLRNQNNIDMTTLEIETSNHSRKKNTAVTSSKDNNPIRQFHLENSLYQLATTISNLALVCERNYQYDKAIALLDEALTVFESINADTTEIEDLIESNQKRLAHDQAALFSTGSKLSPHDVDNCNQNATFDTDDNSIDSARSSLLFGNADGIPDSRTSRQRRSLATRLAMYQSDQHDFILLGPLHHRQWTTEQRVRETVYVWFGKRIPNEEGLYDSDDEDDSLLQDESLLGGSTQQHHQYPSVQMERYRSLKDSILSTVLTYGETTITGVSDGTSLLQRHKEAIPVDTDGNNVVNAELHLNAIYRQAMLHLDRNEVKDALDLFRMALRNHRQKYGDIHHLIGTAIHNIGMVHLFARQYDDAILAFQEAVNVRVAVLGMDHPDVQLSMMKIGIIQLAIGNLSGSRATLWDIRDKSLEVLGNSHPNLAKVMNNIGVVAYECGDLVNALRSFEIAYEYQNQFYEKVADNTSVLQHEQQNSLQSFEGNNVNNGNLPSGNNTNTDVYNSNRSAELAGVATANILCNMGFVYGNDGGEKVEALKLYETALRIFVKHLSSDDYRIHDTKKSIDYLVRTSLEGYHSNVSDRNIFSKMDHSNNDQLNMNNNNRSNTNSSPGMCGGIGNTAIATLKEFSLLEERKRMCTLETIPSEISTILHRTSRSESSTTTSSSCTSIALLNHKSNSNNSNNDNTNQHQQMMINSLQFFLNASDNICRQMFTKEDD